MNYRQEGVSKKEWRPGYDVAIGVGMVVAIVLLRLPLIFLLFAIAVSGMIATWQFAKRKWLESLCIEALREGKDLIPFEVLQYVQPRWGRNLLLGKVQGVLDNLVEQGLATRGVVMQKVSIGDGRVVQTPRLIYNLAEAQRFIAPHHL